MNPISTGHTSYGPLQRRLLGLAGFLSLVIIALVVFHALHTGETGLNAVAEAAQRTAKQPGAKIAIEVKYRFEGDGKTLQISGTGSGDYDARSGRSDASLSVPVPGHSTLTVESIATKRKVFLRSPTFAGELPAGKEWLGMEPLLGHSTQTAVGSESGAGSTLAMLEAIGSGAERLDQQSVRGHLCTRYKGTIEPQRIAALLREKGEVGTAKVYEAAAARAPDPIPVEVWVDGKGLVRQVEYVQQIPTPIEDITAKMDMRMQFFAFGHRSHIPLPRKSEVFDYTPTLRNELGLDDGSSLGALEPPAGAKPLTDGAFRRAGQRICRRVDHDGRGLLEQAFRFSRTMKALPHTPAGIERAQSTERDAGIHVFEPLARLMRQGTRELAALTPPAHLATSYRRYLKDQVLEEERVLALTRAFDLGSLRSPILKEDGETEAVKQARRELAKQLGIPTCEQSESTGPGADSTLE